MNLAATIQAQMLQTLLAAMQAGDPGPKAGENLRATFAGWTTPDGAPPAAGASATAEAVIAGRRVALLLTADAARLRSLTPGAVMTLAVDQPASADMPAQMRLTGIAAAQAVTGQDGTQDAARAAAGGLTDLAEGAQPLRQSASPLAQTLAARAAAGPVIGAALGRQDSLAPLLANLSALSSAASDLHLGLQAAIPRPVLAAAEAVLGFRLAATEDGVPSDQLRQAVARSGLFHEAQLARGQPSLAAGDLKSALLALRAALQAEAPQAASPAGTRPDSERSPSLSPRPGEVPAPVLAPRPAPPQREGLPAAQSVSPASIDFAAETASSVIGKLAAQTEAALDRLSLAQFASLPSPQDAAPLNRWFAEIPLMPGTGTAVLPLEIEEDRGGQAHEGPQAKTWRVRFALDLAPMGLIHALVTMQARAISVMVWAERESTSKMVRDFAPDLQAALADGGFDRADIDVAMGRPSARPASAGHYLDRVS